VYLVKASELEPPGIISRVITAMVNNANSKKRSSSAVGANTARDRKRVANGKMVRQPPHLMDSRIELDFNIVRTTDYLLVACVKAVN
jgi:hypothetical protein